MRLDENLFLSSVRLHFSVLKLAALLLIIFFGSHTVVLAKGELSGTERWILTKVKAGEIANLNDPAAKIPRERRTIDSSFLEGLITNTLKGFTVPQTGVSITGAVLTDPVTIPETLRIPYQVRLSDCLFQDHVEVNAVHFLERLVIAGSEFKSADFTDLDVTGNLDATGVIFKERVRFSGARIGGAAYFRKARFDGPTEFAFVNVGIVFDASEAHFNYRRNGSGDDPSLTVSFNTMKIGGQANFRDTIFEGPADFSYLSTNYNLEVQRALFLNPDEEILFKSMTIGGNLMVDKAVFNSAASFYDTVIGKSFVGNDTQFNNAKLGVRFSGMKLDAFQFKPATVGSEKKLAGPLRIDEMSYQHIYGSHEDLIWLVDHAEYSSDIFSNLEAYYRKQGDTDGANQIYIRGRQREREGMKPAGYLWNLLLDWVAGYGRDLKRALYFSIFFIFVGSIVFWRAKGMETQKKNDADRYKYHPIWYSIALFLPVISLEDANIWMPKTTRRCARIYMRVHIILGYLLIPIGLAAWTFPLLAK